MTARKTDGRVPAWGDQSSGGGGGGGTVSTGEALIWEWDQATITQFDAASPQYSDGGVTSALSVVDIPQWGNALRITSSGGTGVCAAFLATMPIPYANTDRNLRIELETHDVSFSGSYFGAVVMATLDGSDYYGLHHYMFGTAEWSSRVDANVRTQSGGTGTGLQGSGFARIRMRGRKLAATPPAVSSYYIGEGRFNEAGEVRRTGTSRGVGISEFANNTVVPASWNDLACDRFGITIQSSAGNAPPPTADILSMRVYLIGESA